MTNRKRIKVSKKVGLSPGTLLHIGTKETQKNTVDLISFNETEIYETSNSDFSKIISAVKNENINWINVDGLQNVELIEKVGKHFGLDTLMMEDILNTQQRPKLEEHDSQMFLTLKMLSGKENDIISYEQISIVLCKNYILTFQEKEGTAFNSIKERMRSNGTVRKRKADYLFCRLTDTIVDSYYIALDNFGDRMERLEESVYRSPDSKTLHEIQYLKKDLILLRKSIYPIREAIGKILKEEPEIIEKQTMRYFYDVYDHTIHIAETMEIYRDLSAGLVDMYITNINFRMNEVIKVLTIISTIFIPLTFIVGIYGMNFDFMPELHWKWGYPLIMLLMTGSAVWMVFYMKRKKWF